MVEFLFVFLFSHFTGDFVFQTDKIAYLKSKGVKGLLIHSLVVTAIQIACMSLFGFKGIIAAFLAGCVHFFIDWLKSSTNNSFSRFQALFFIIDQALHILVLLGFSMLFASDIPSGTSITVYAKYGIAFITSTYIASVYVKILLRDLFPPLKNEAFFKAGERITDMLFGLAAAGVVLVSNIVYLPLILCQAVVYYIVQKRIFKYSLLIIIIKFVTLLVFAVISAVFVYSKAS